MYEENVKLSHEGVSSTPLYYCLSWATPLVRWSAKGGRRKVRQTLSVPPYIDLVGTDSLISEAEYQNALIVNHALIAAYRFGVNSMTRSMYDITLSESGCQTYASTLCNDRRRAQ